jgi:hypothetical protein
MEATEMSEAAIPPETRVREAEHLTDRYVALWNEADPERRRRTIGELWTEDGSQILQPPLEIRAIAARPGIGMAVRLEARGHAELEARAATSYEHWVDSDGLRFRRRDNVDRLHDVVKFHWEAGSQDGQVTAVGLVFLMLATDGRIRRDYVLIESQAMSSTVQSSRTSGGVIASAEAS